MKILISTRTYEIYSTNVDSKYERCGVLVGKQISEQHYKVMKIIEDKNPSHCGPFGVTRDIKHVYTQMQEEIDKDNSLDYLGEWHTHPFGPNSASFIDIISMKQMVNNPSFGQVDWVIMIIFFPKSLQKAFFFNDDGCQEMEIEFY